MKLKTILLGAALAGVSLVAPSNLVQAQVCPRIAEVPPAKPTRILRNDSYGYRFSIPQNYRAMAFRSNGILVFDPGTFETAQCYVRNKVPTELPSGISVYATPVNPGNRSVADLVRQNPLATITGTRTVANQTAVTYNTDAMGYGDANVSFFTPDQKHMIIVSAPFQSQQNSRGERVRGEIFNKSVFDTVVSSFIFVRR